MKKHIYKCFPVLFVLLIIILISLSSCTSDSSSSTPFGIDNVGNQVVIQNDDPLIRSTNFGMIKGKRGEADTYGWLGVPFAKPPVGELRWKAPQDPASWNGVLQTDEFSNFCPQYGNYISETGEESFGGLWGQGVVVGDEDCLYLNIWRPETDEEQLPVYVFIHGGANILGRADLPIYNGANLASRQNMVVVTINYRLGTLGWFAHSALHTGDPEDNSGNFGTLDIIKSLKWIQNNIAAFGGDPDNVTISGQSAGGMNVYSLMVSPLTEGLFHKAIPMSGAPTHVPMDVAEERAWRILSRLIIQDGFQGDPDEAIDLALSRGNAWIEEYLRSKTLEELFPPELGGPLGMNLDAGILAITQMGIYSDGYVISQDPFAALSSGKYHHLPLMLGCTTQEFKLFIPFILIEPNVLFDFMEAFDPNDPQYHLTDLLDPALWPLLLIYEPISRLGQLIFQGYGVDTTAGIIRNHQEEIYAYKFAWDEEPEPLDFFLGAAHAMDIPFVFGNFVEDKKSLTSFAWSESNREGREKLSDAMMTYFAQFAKTGNPNPPGSDLPEWTPWHNEPNTPKRIIFDTGDLYMSSKQLEPDEIPSISSIIGDVIEIINNP